MLFNLFWQSKTIEKCGIFSIIRDFFFFLLKKTQLKNFVDTYQDFFSKIKKILLKKKETTNNPDLDTLTQFCSEFNLSSNL